MLLGTNTAHNIHLYLFLCYLVWKFECKSKYNSKFDNNKSRLGLHNSRSVNVTKDNVPAVDLNSNYSSEHVNRFDLLKFDDKDEWLIDWLKPTMWGAAFTG